MLTMILGFIGNDSFGRPVYNDKNEELYKDINCGLGEMSLFTVIGDFDGEPDRSVSAITKYDDIEFKFNILGLPERLSFNYQMLSRLRSDCEYYLGYGNRNKSRLWSGDEKAQIIKMKAIHNSFSADKKPEWLSWDEILEYEKKMTVGEKTENNGGVYE